MAVEKSHSNDKLLEKIISSNYHMEQKTYVEASCIYNIHTGVYFGLYEPSFSFTEERRPSKYWSCEVNLISYM